MTQSRAHGAPSRPRRIALGLGACAAAMEAGLLSLAALERPASHIPELITHYLLLGAVWLTACALVARGAAQLGSRRTLLWVWAAAVVFRLTVAPLDPSLSEDTARYRWQGMAQDAGADPYRAVPEDPRWDGLRDATWPRVAGKDKASVYGPVLEQVNLWTFRLIRGWEDDPWRQVWLFKLPFALADLAVGLALLSLLSAAGRPLAWALVYLWSPLAVIEFWVEGHNDAWAVAFVVAALALSLRARPNWALAAATMAVGCKFWPVVLLPFLALTRTRGRWRIEWRGLLACAPLAVALCLPYWPGIGAVAEGLEGFVGGWRNNDSLFAALLVLAGGDSEAAARTAGVTLVAAVAVLWTMRLPRLAPELAAVGALLLLSANCFPWYLAWLLPLLAVHPAPPLLLWTALVPLAYHVVPLYEAAGVWEYDRFVVWLEYGPVLGWLAVLGVRAWRRRFGRGGEASPPAGPG